MGKEFKIAVLGCGVIGERRSTQLPSEARVVACYDTNATRAQALAAVLKSRAYSSLADVFEEKPDAAILAAINSALVPLAQECLRRGIHVLIEKPAARSSEELASLENPARHIVKIGFNHRFHPAFQELKRRLLSHPEDPVMFINARYGNGARLGFENEWRAKSELSGGGELLDQGVHIIDLASEILGSMEVKTAWVRTHYWPMEVDDNAWAICGTPSGQTFTMHVSSTEWKNDFRFEVYTRHRKYQWLGLGRSYGTEKLITYTMPPEMGPPTVEELVYSGEDRSWLDENTNFLESISGKTRADGDHADGVRALQIVRDIYHHSARLKHDRPHPQWWEHSQRARENGLMESLNT